MKKTARQIGGPFSSPLCSQFTSQQLSAGVQRHNTSHSLACRFIPINSDFSVIGIMT